MKMKYENLARLKIDVQTTNDRNFLELSILFDKPDFLEWLLKIRKKYGFDQLVKLDDYDSKLDEIGRSGIQGKFDLSTYREKIGSEIIEYARRNETWFGGIEEDGIDLSQLIDTDISILCYLFRRPPYFSDYIKQAVFCGAVEGDLFYPTQYHIVENDTLQSTTGSFQLPQIVISVSPTSTDLEIKEQVMFARHLLKTDKRLAYYKPRIDKVNKIRAYREWYWQHLTGKTYVQISTDWMDNPDVSSSDSGSDENRVLKGVAYYRKLLSI
ncbi:MAG: hypothetical protein US86_C0002G0058 [Candidatus Daviesbacteria bacterium GW2011_GWA2_38_24]|uniref:Uncharacterized protein n=1 Tax=Candidatus Daviesbacteria bacterium GW2011_GWA2_38_24 TaxID=1618422 RepID=A0A0G0MPT2_9BACT|nr:MAG: hypothetical protein US86_C0002G0058 [Candidatus Daviesbacteria bacterium GW2011_GWA2_38_24]KKQ79307.1 MAG: hypothetical protein UT01_C0043G0005 [Candidatus Daviesbacteria bacterium GW2011_GWA1_38_7]